MSIIQDTVNLISTIVAWGYLIFKIGCPIIVGYYIYQFLTGHLDFWITLLSSIFIGMIVFLLIPSIHFPSYPDNQDRKFPFKPLYIPDSPISNPDAPTPGPRDPIYVPDPPLISRNGDSPIPSFIQTPRAALVDSYNPVTRDFALKLVHSENGGSYNLPQVFDIWDHCSRNWTYVNDPGGRDYYSPASRTIENGLRGDCDDFTILIVALIEAIGGSGRMVAAKNSAGEGHCYPEVYIGHSKSGLEDAIAIINDRYNNPSVHWHSEDRAGGTHYWLNLDWSANHPGGPIFDSVGEIKVYYSDDSRI